MAKTFRLTIKTENAAFEDDGLHVEVARILRALADKLEGPYDFTRYHALLDGNGNKVGRAGFNLYPSRERR